MNQRSIGGHHQSIRWVKKSRQRAASCRSLSTGWTDGKKGLDCGLSDGCVHFIQRHFDLKFFSTGELTHRRCTRRIIASADFQRSHDVERHWMNRCLWKGERQFIRWYMFLQLLANDSLVALGYLYSLHSPIWGGWIVWKCRGVWDTYKIISKPYKC
jgi:hypothetical protein